MEVIVTGATSFIGRAVIGELIARGCHVYAVIRPDSPSLGEFRGLSSVTVIERRLQDIEGMELPLYPAAEEKGSPPYQESLRYWLHLGWEGAGSANRQNPELQARNIGYALAALRTAARLGCSRFLFTGSQAEYGICQGTMTEDMVCAPVSEYGKNKLKVCYQAAAEAEALGIRYIHARIFSVYGPGDHPWSLISACTDTFLKGGHMEMGPCTQQWNFLYVTEAASVLAKLLLGKVPAGVYNVAGEDTRPLRSYIEELYDLCGRKGSYRFGSRPPNAEGVVSLVPDLRKLKGAIDFTQEISFKKGIACLIREAEEETD